MSLLNKTKNLLQKYNLKPIHSRGQNFLINEKILDKIINSSDLHSNDTVLEVGPGLGVLTKKIAQNVKNVIAVELDKNLVDILKTELWHTKNIDVVNGDILKTDFCDSGLTVNGKSFDIGDYRIVANLPYNITSKFIRMFLEAKKRPIDMVLMVQKEVAERITAKPGKMSLLALSCQLYADCNVEFFVEKNNFLPVPKVDSAIVRIVIKDNGIDVDRDKLFKIARAGFSSKRKKLVSNLSNVLKIKKADMRSIFKELNLNENARAQELSINDWVRLVEMI